MYLKNKIIAAIVGILVLGFSCTPANEQKEDSQDAKDKETTTQVKNIIFLIGDGMGLSQVSSAFYYQDKEPSFKRFNHIGLIRTSSAKQKITDSAAGATAFACGEKSYNGAIGVDVNGDPLTSIIDILSENGLSTGLIATSSITHATPACFYAKAKQRSEEELIASQLPGSGVDFFAGGGIQFFSGRSDGLNYLDSLQAHGFKVDTSSLDVNGINSDEKYGFLLAKEGMPRMLDGRGDYLPQATQAALDYLSQKDNGFFLMVEGSQIDWGGHENNAEYLISEELDFDKTIDVALDYAEQHDNTLVVVTADHETGGFSLASNDGDYNDIKPTFSTGGHTTTLIPVFAFGPGAENFGGIYENTGIFHKMVELIGN